MSSGSRCREAAFIAYGFSIRRIDFVFTVICRRRDCSVKAVLIFLLPHLLVLVKSWSFIGHIFIKTHL
jgi:hypothetical protein